MKKKFLQFLLFMTMLPYSTSMFGQVVFDFDQNGKELFGLPGESTEQTPDGDILTDVQATIGEISIIVSPKTEGITYNNRIWANAPKLRLYSGTCKLESSGSNIKNVIFYHRGRFYLEPNIGSFSNQEGQSIWTGDAKEIVFTVNKNTQIDSISVWMSNLPPTPGPGPDPDPNVLKVNTFVELASVSDGDDIRLMLNQAHVLYNQNGYAFLQDETSAPI